MTLLPRTRSPWWLLVFAITALLWTGALMGVRALGGGEFDPASALTVAKVAAAGAAALALLGALGARFTFLLAHAGLLVGWAFLMNTVAGPHEGFADLAGVAFFMVAGAVGLGLGAIVDLVRFFRRAP